MDKEDKKKSASQTNYKSACLANDNLLQMEMSINLILGI
jgi:hypothetical protein